MAAGAHVAYLDNNATTFMSPGTITMFTRWLNRGNASADYASAREARKLMLTFRHLIARVCRFALVDAPGGRGDGYRVLFTSGASEANCTILTSCARAYRAKRGRVPHIIVSAVEHKSVLLCCRRLQHDRLADVSQVPVQKSGAFLGTVAPEDVKGFIRPTTCLISIMAANNETGAVNDIRAIAAVARGARVPFHTDAVQSFGKHPLLPAEMGVDAFSVSFHKLGGPLGAGLLVVRQHLVEGYDLPPLVCGTQNYGLRGGTENIPAIAAALAAFVESLQRRAEKNARMERLRTLIKRRLAKRHRCIGYDEYRGDGPPGALIVWLEPAAECRLPNTLLMAVRAPRFCNAAARRALETRNVIVSIGSACDTGGGARPSHVLEAMAVPAALARGTLRISLGDTTTADDCMAFVQALSTIISRLVEASSA